MHKIMFLVLIVSSLVANAGNINGKVNRGFFTYNLTRGINQIMQNAPKLGRNDITELYTCAMWASDKYKVPVNILLAIAFVESSYKLSEVNKGSKDYGIMQVNSYHIRVSKLDKSRLLTDMAYSFDKGAGIFAWFYRRYPLEEAVMRYNCGTRKTCIKWRSVRRYLNKVLKAI